MPQPSCQEILTGISAGVRDTYYRLRYPSRRHIEATVDSRRTAYHFRSGIDIVEEKSPKKRRRKLREKIQKKTGQSAFQTVAK